MVQIEAARSGVAALAISSDNAELPVGAAYRAIRSPRGERPSLANQDSAGSDITAKTLSPSGSCDLLDLNPSGVRTASAGNVAKEDLAKRAQTRVTERKRTELEKKQEQEKQRLKKQESDKMKKEHDTQLKQRRRAEIYALNAILRQLQQEKMAAFINAHKRDDGDQQQQQQDFASECSEASMVQSIGV